MHAPVTTPSVRGRLRARHALLLTVASVLSAPTLRAQQPIEPRAGLVITSSVRLAPGTWRLDAPASTDSALIIVRGDNITVDLRGVTLVGSDTGAAPDAARGVAIRIDGGRNVRIRGARIRGYRFAILARGTQRLELIDNDLSYGWKPRLFSLVEHESLADWLSFHRNDDGEWLRFGAAIFLDGVRGGTIRGNRAVQGMNALLMARTDSVLVRDNVFAFNSGLGIGLYRSSHNTIVRNRVDYNVRGYSHGFYRRGQDSAGILLYEQSQHNVVAFNSATHGGDGLFLWAGQSTMDTGEGGANDNVFLGNDFSFAPTNAMEATFSRNAFLANRAEGSTYGLWGGYSWESIIAANCFADNQWGIAIEHGQDNVIVGNRFLRDSTAIRLWANPIEPSDWGYPRHRDTRSRDYRIEGNVFLGNRVRIDTAATTGVTVARNDSVVRVTTCDRMPAVPPEFAALVPRLPGIPRSVPASPEARRPRSAIVVDEWGPYDWQSPKLWPVDSTHSVPLRLAVLGPPGAWRLVERRGLADVSALEGRTGDTLVVRPRPDSLGDWRVTLEYRGAATVSPRGTAVAAGEPVRFSYERFEPSMHWDVRFTTWNDHTDPRTRSAAFDSLFRLGATFARQLPRLDFMWYRPQVRELPQARWGLEAATTVALPPGTYTLRTLSDDGIRVWVDDVLVIDNWDLHGTEVDYAPLDGGVHRLRVQYFQVDGWTELRLDILRGVERSPGSPGPH